MDSTVDAAKFIPPHLGEIEAVVAELTLLKLDPLLVVVRSSTTGQ
jgi:hypothetical protein